MDRLTIRNSDGSVSQPARTSVEQVFYRLAAYEDTGLEPEEYKAHVDVLRKLDIEHMHDLLVAERDGRLVVLPCKDATVYTVEEDLFKCDDCENKDKAHYQPSVDRIRCDYVDAHCPWVIRERAVEGFKISFKDGRAILSAPGEWRFEGFKSFSGIDGTWYLTRDEAESALEGEQK